MIILVKGIGNLWDINISEMCLCFRIFVIALRIKYGLDNLDIALKTTVPDRSLSSATSSVGIASGFWMDDHRSF